MLNLEFMLDFQVVQHECWRLRNGLPARQRLAPAVRRRRPNRQQPARPALRPRVYEPDRLVEVLNKWGWKRRSASCFETPHGLLDLAWDGIATMKHAARTGWERALWQLEPRVGDDNSKQKYDSHHPCFTEHKTWLGTPRAAHRQGVHSAGCRSRWPHRWWRH